MVFHNLTEKEKDLNIMIRNIILLAVHVIQLGHGQRLISRNLRPRVAQDRLPRAYGEV